MDASRSLAAQRCCIHQSRHAVWLLFAAAALSYMSWLCGMVVQVRVQWIVPMLVPLCVCVCRYVSGFLPRAVYASGKASSAAGLTASVIKVCGVVGCNELMS